MPDSLKPGQDSGTPSKRHRSKTEAVDVPAPGTRRPHAESTDKDYDELEALRRYVFTQR